MPRGGTRFWLWFCFFSTFFWDPLYVFVFVFVPTQKSRHLIAPAAGELYATRVHRTVEEETTHLENRQMPKIWISRWKDDCDHLKTPIIEGFQYCDSGTFLKASPPLGSLQRGALSLGWRILVRKSQSCVQHCPALANACNAWSANVEATYWTQCIWCKKYWNDYLWIASR